MHFLSQKKVRHGGNNYAIDHKLLEADNIHVETGQKKNTITHYASIKNTYNTWPKTNSDRFKIFDIQRKSTNKLTIELKPSFKTCHRRLNPWQIQKKWMNKHKLYFLTLLFWQIWTKSSPDNYLKTSDFEIGSSCTKRDLIFWNKDFYLNSKEYH